MNLQTQPCPCCGNSLLRHVSHGKLYWFCTSCRLEVPLFAVNRTSRLETGIKRELPVKG